MGTLWVWTPNPVHSIIFVSVLILKCFNKSVISIPFMKIREPSHPYSSTDFGIYFRLCRAGFPALRLCLAVMHSPAPTKRVNYSLYSSASIGCSRMIGLQSLHARLMAWASATVVIAFASSMTTLEYLMPSLDDACFSENFVITS